MSKFINEAAKMVSLIQRMENPKLLSEANKLTEDIINEMASARRVATPDEIFDILDKIGNNKFVTIGYVTSANLNIPQIKKKNPLTNRMKNYPDWRSFSNEIGSDNEVAGLVKLTSYNMRYVNRELLKNKYDKYVSDANDIRSQYGLEPMKVKSNNYVDKMNFGSGVGVYGGDNENLQGHAYVSQNTYGSRIKSYVYAIDGEGHIMQELKPEQVQPYLKAKGEVSGVSQLRKMNKEEEEIKQYIEKINGLKFNYRNFEFNSIAYIVATVDGEKIIYINNNLNRVVDDVDINKNDFLSIVKERYSKDLEELD